MKIQWSEYRKAAVAVATAVVEVVAVWQDAPEWALGAAAVAGAVLVYATPNRAGAKLPHLNSTELFELAEKAQDRERRL